MMIALRFAGWLLGLWLLGGCASTVTSTPREPQETRAATIAACTDLVLDYALYRDQRNPQKYAELFARDAVLNVQGQTFTGREAIRNRMLAAKNAPKTRHMMSTIRISPVSDTRATGVSYVTVYMAPGAEGEVTPVNGFAIVGSYIDEFVQTDEGWRIAARRLDGAFSLGNQE